MTETLTLPALDPIPDDIDAQIGRLLHVPPEPGLEEWLLELIKGSGHLSNADDMRWRLLSMVWLATCFDAEKAWPYLMWLNVNEPVISDHLCEILSEAANDFNCHVQLANWIANAADERLTTFFSEFHNIPDTRQMPALLGRLLARPTAPQTGVWLAAYCRDTRGHVAAHIRRWCLVASAWYATCFDPQEGLTYLQEHGNGSQRLSPADNKLLMETAAEFNGVSPMIGWIAACPDPAVKTMLQDFGHPDLMALSEETLQQPPAYEPLADPTGQAAADAHLFKRNQAILEEGGLDLDSAEILNLACGALAPQTVLFNSAGWRTVGVDLHLPPGYLPLPGLIYWLKRRRHAGAWKEATAPYYEALAQQAGLKLKWRKVQLELADLTRLQFPDHRFGGVICTGYLQHAPDVDGLLAEAARVLQPGGLLLADVVPYPALSGAFHAPDSTPPWSHLRDPHHNLEIPLNRWRESQYRAAFEKHFIIEQWQSESDEKAVAQLSPEIRAELADYSQAELTQKEIVILARKR